MDIRPVTWHARAAGTTTLDSPGWGDVPAIPVGVMALSRDRR
jgi:hypothetical protein